MALLSGLPAKEIVVSTLGVLYAEGTEARPEVTEGPIATAEAAGTRPEAGAQPPESVGIIGGADGPTSIAVADGTAAEHRAAELSEEEQNASLSRRLLASGDFSKASALAFLVFILLYVPCIATVVAIGSEAGWKWAVASILYNTAVAWVVAWIVYHIASIF